MKPLIYPKKDRIKGVYAYCQKCKTSIGSGKCQKTKRRISSCEFTQFHTYRASVIVPNTGGTKRKKKILNTCNLAEAIRLKFQFEKDLKELHFQTAQVHITPKESKSDYLINCMDMYIRYLKNEGVEIHKQKERGVHHIKAVERFFRYFCLCLKSKQIDHVIFRVEELNDTVVGFFHSYVLDELKYENKTYNKVMACFRQFLGWLIEEKSYNLDNPFLGVVKRKEKIDKTVINQNELYAVLDAVKLENSLKVFSNGVRKYYYRDWVKTAFRIALETGLRREEFMTLKFSDIQTDEYDKPIFIRVENFKVNRILGLKDEEEKEIKVIPVTTAMLEILEELNFKEAKNSGNYLIGNNEKANRKTLVNFISRAFTHFWKQTGIEKDVSLKHLRKTYLTSLVGHFGDKANIISNHAGIEVLKKHYVNDEALMKGIEAFSVFK